MPLASSSRPPVLPPTTACAGARKLRPAGSLFCQRVLDLAIALVLFVLTLPLMLVIALLVRLTSRGPALYTQLRVGLGGKPFWILKFRSMAENCEARSGAKWSVPGDPRVTALGRFLRASHLDELPQLINVILGQMSLVGPRPERPEFVPALAAAIPDYNDRLLVRPGVTGVAQVHLPPDTNLESVRRKLHYDRWYIANRGMWLDLRLIAATALKVLLLPASFGCRLFWVPGRARIESNPKYVVPVSVPVSERPSDPELSTAQTIPEMEGFR